jgi:hypothetical protein
MVEAMNALSIDEIKAILAKGFHGKLYQKIASVMSLNPDLLKDSLPLLKEKGKIGMRYSWLIGGLLDMKPELVKEHVHYFYKHLNEADFPNYDRSIAKLFYLAGCPDDLKGEVINLLFQWLNDPGISVSTKNYAAQALTKISEEIPDLKNELILVLTEQRFRNKTSFEKLSAHLIKALKQN